MVWRLIGCIGITLFYINSSYAQKGNCNCKFDNKSYQAYGTAAPCGVYMYHQTCEISFTGLGASKSLLEESKFSATIKISEQFYNQHLDLIRNNELGIFIDPDFIEVGLISLSRGVLYRDITYNLDINVNEIELLISNFAAEFKNRIALVFQGEEDPFNLKFSDNSEFKVGRGFVEMEYNDQILSMIFFSEN